jgi:hypothetical protein
MNLLEIQRRMAAAIMAPLGPADGIATRTPGGRSMEAEAGEIITPNDRLTSVERLEIYARSYWYRLLDCFADDFPGLRAVLGQRTFDRLARAYLAELPSRSYTLRNLGSRLRPWLETHPGYAGQNLALALDMVRLEWAHIEAFDGPAERVLGPEDLVELNPDMVFRLQPYLTLLDLRYPVDDLRIQIQDLPEGHAGASNAVLRSKERRVVQRHSVKPEAIFLAVHRHEDSVYYRRVEPDEFRLLKTLGSGKPVGEAIESVFADSDVAGEELGTRIQEWFAAWSQNGWFCHP